MKLSNEQQKHINDLLNQLTLDEKIKLCSGSRFFDTNPIKRLGIKRFRMTDGPFGISMHSSFFRKNTRFPGGICLAATWNPDLAKEYGKAAGEEARAVGRHAILAPSINIDRSPLNGRTFEYFSEDPFLTKELAVSYVKGVQSQKVAACIKHYVANNQETNRFTISAEIDERTLHEIYLRAFRETILEANPWMIMTSYNKVNGKYIFESKELLEDLLWAKWGFSGFVVSDWYSLARSDPPVSPEDCIEAGLSLEMPSANKYKPEFLKQLYSAGKITDSQINKLIIRFLTVMTYVGLFENKKIQLPSKRNTADHQRLSQTMAEDGIVLLKNTGSLLPLNFSTLTKIAVLGPNLNRKFGKLLAGGSSAVKPPYEITPFQGLKERCKDKIQLLNDSSIADVAIVFAGLDHYTNQSMIRRNKRKDVIPFGNDSEGTDRIRLELPESQVQLIKSTAKKNPKTIVVLINGSPIGMDDWLEDVPVVLEAWYSGMHAGRAIANILFGDVNPSGKLPISFPKSLSDSPAHKSPKTFPGENLKVNYEEGIFIGYRYTDGFDIEPLFPFGFGLTYSKFVFKDVTLDKTILKSIDDELKLKIQVFNAGERAGAEVVQVYAKDLECSIKRPPKELIGFQKVYIDSKEQKTIEIPIKAKNLAFYDSKVHNWVIEPGRFFLMIGNSSRDFQLETEIIYSKQE
ncbi:MAG: glycosyl hydrolase [Candidatus Heimdallarchaeota archaeon]|nr:glycosyl hydrolase [Candidatus Heimdallarchaeota archaeon]